MKITSCQRVLSLSALLVSLVAGEEILQNWYEPYPYEEGDPDSGPLAGKTANVGDVIHFEWSGQPHNVYIHPTGTCSQIGRIFVGETSGVKYTIKPEEAGTTVWFSCDTPVPDHEYTNHCKSGQIIPYEISGDPVAPTDLTPVEAPVDPPAPMPVAPETLSPVAAPTTGTVIEQLWYIPYEEEAGDPLSGPFELQSAMVGDTVRFDWSGFHDVHIHPSGDCTQLGRIFLGDSSGVEYTFRAEDAGKTIWFACDTPTVDHEYTNHCKDGQIIGYEVAGSGPAPSPVSTSDCLDTSVRFRVTWNGKLISRDCVWIGNKATKMRCALEGVSDACPESCDTGCATCVDSSLRFRVTWNNKKIMRDCIWVSNKATKMRCALPGVSHACRATCGLC